MMSSIVALVFYRYLSMLNQKLAIKIGPEIFCKIKKILTGKYFPNNIWIYQTKKLHPEFMIRNAASNFVVYYWSAPVDFASHLSTAGWPQHVIFKIAASKVVDEKHRNFYTKNSNVCPISPQCPICVPNVPNFCLMSHVSSQCPKFLLNILNPVWLGTGHFYLYVFVRSDFVS